MKHAIRLLPAVLLSVSLGRVAPAAEDTGAYLGLSVGQSKTEDFCEGAATCDDTDTAWKVLGGYRLNANFAVEGVYQDLGGAVASGTVSDPDISFTGTLDSDAWALSVDAVGILPLGDKFNLFGKVGMAYTSVDATLRGSGTAFGQPFSGSFSHKDSDVGLKLGVGVAFEVIDKLSVRFEWERFNDAGGDYEADIDLISLGVTYRF